MIALIADCKYTLCLDQVNSDRLLRYISALQTWSMEVDIICNDGHKSEANGNLHMVLRNLGIPQELVCPTFPIACMPTSDGGLR